MRIVAVVEVSYWNIPIHGRGPKQRSTLVIGKQPVTKELFLLVQNANNPVGVKYKILDNIVQMFTRFLSEGKATVRFHSPPHDLSIHCEDKVLMGTFMRVLKKGTDKKFEVPDSWLSSLYSSRTVPKRAKTELVLDASTRQASLPRTLTSLTAANIGMLRLDPKVPKLQHLEVLDVSRNQLTSVPASLGALRLRSLNLAGNMLGDTHDWEFLYGRQLVDSLHTLDLSGNSLNSLPLQLGNLTRLISLKFGNNNLEDIPSNVGLLRNLRTLDTSENRIAVFPGTIQELKLENFNISENVCRELDPEENTIVNKSDSSVPSLVELAAVSILNNRLEYHGVLPKSLDEGLQTATFCRCGSATFGGHVQHATFNVHHVSVMCTVTAQREYDPLRKTSGLTVCILNTYCSAPCIRKYHRFVSIHKRRRT